MRYVPFDELDGRPNVIVDGYPAQGTVLALSHWVGSGTPEQLADDLSTQIVFRYLDQPEMHVAAEAVSNNHFDEDGLCGIFAVVDPQEALARRERMIDVASAGDFGVYTDREALRVMLAIAAYGEQDISPLGDEVFALPYPQQSARLYEELLGRLPELLDHPERYRALWEQDDARIAADEERVRDGTVAIAEDPAIDLAIVKAPAFVHEVAVNNATRRFRVLQMAGRRYELLMRYETWVAYVTEPTMPRVDLSPLAEQLSGREAAGTWRFDGVESITPRLRLGGAEESSIPPEEFEAAVVEFLRAAR